MRLVIQFPTRHRVNGVSTVDFFFAFCQLVECQIQFLEMPLAMQQSDAALSNGTLTPP